MPIFQKILQLLETIKIKMFFWFFESVEIHPMLLSMADHELPPQLRLWKKAVIVL
jgi:hypothetical protein